MKKKVMLLMFIVFCGFVFSLDEVKAINVTGGKDLKFDNYGLTTKVTGRNVTSYKLAGDKEAYCIQVKKSFLAGEHTTSNCTDNGINDGIEEMNFIVAGQIIDVVDSKDWSKEKKYVHKVAAINTYFKSLNLDNLSPGSAKFDDKVISEIISDAKSRATYYGANKSKNISKPNFGVASKTMNIVSGSENTFISDRITFSNLDAKFNGSVPVYTFSTKGTGKIYLCTIKNGDACKLASEVKISGYKSISYYLKVVGGKTNETVSLTIVGNSSTDYTTSGIYCNGTKYQSVLVGSSANQTYKNQNKITFQIPDTTKHQISILKVDESGEEINGSEFELYEEGISQKLTLTKNGSLFTYVSPLVSTDNDTFFNKKYCYKETVVPSGYRRGVDGCFDVSEQNRYTCYNNDTSESVDDLDYCDSNITSMCKIQKSVVNVTIDEDDTSGEEDGTSDQKNYIESDPVLSTEYIEISEAGCVAPESSETTTETGIEKVTYIAETKCVLKNNDGSYDEMDEKYCRNKDHYSLIEVNSGNVFITVPNQKNNIKIAKIGIVYDEEKGENVEKEISGAQLKICTKKDYDDKKNDCSAAKTIDGVELSWIDSESVVEFAGLVVGSYYIVEVVPPAGYVLPTKSATMFSIDESGVVKTGDKEVKDNEIIIKNEENELYISKTDIVTGKEISGAKLSICTTVTTDIDVNGNNSLKGNEKFILDLDQFGNCLPVSLANGEEATWISTNEPHKIKGLPAGTYYLVEISAPNGYSVAESILFTMQDDGILLDSEGKPINDNKIIMQDEPIKQVSTGVLSLYIVIGVTVLVGIVTICTYYYTAKGIVNKKTLNNKIRKRKIHRKFKA